MTVKPGTRVVGMVDFRNDRFAFVTPLYNDVGTGWTAAQPEDYPSRGLVFWRQPHLDVSPGSAVAFDLEEGKGERDAYTVRNAEFLTPLLDYGLFSYDEALERLTTSRLPAGEEVLAGLDIFAWCKGDLLLGPLTPRIEDGRFYIPSDSLRLERVPYREGHGENAIFQLPNSRYYCAPTSPVTGSLDCRSDAEVLKTALRDAVSLAEKESIPVPGFLATKNLIQKTADLLREGDRLEDRQYKLDRITRALKICEESDEVRTLTREIASALRGDPVVKAELERDRATIRSQVVAEAMEQVRKDIETENSILSQLRDEKSALDKEYVSTRALLEKTQRELESAKNDLSRQLESIENSVADRIAELVDDASDLLSESVILRAVGVGSSATSTQPKQIYTAIDPFSGRSSLTPREKTSVSKLLRAAGEAFGIDATVLNRIHAAVRAGLLPVLTGNGGPAALSAYATAVCSGRITSMPVGHDFLHPVDLLGLRAANPPATRVHSGLLPGADAGVRDGGPGLLVLDSFNQAPTESYLLPWLQTHDRGITVPEVAREMVGVARVVPDQNLLFAATTAVGTTTAPVSPDMWGYAVAIDVPKPGRTRANSPTRTTIDRQSVSGPHPQSASLVSKLEESLGAIWVIDDGLLDTSRRFATGLIELQDSSAITTSVLECVILPALATSLSGVNLTDAVSDVLGLVPKTDQNRPQKLQNLAQRLHQRFA
ncbi:hypothetical protein [Rhodococcus phenolicus]|uniref:hypothetical protein n=1 Tax=Rhodococcus phenolicus TaxID=263849 RepID=UPI000A5ABDA0|nr:hypothetical protein [Rhodococcus phenolicus]